MNMNCIQVRRILAQPFVVQLKRPAMFDPVIRECAVQQPEIRILVSSSTPGLLTIRSVRGSLIRAEPTAL